LGVLIAVALICAAANIGYEKLGGGGE